MLKQVMVCLAIFLAAALGPAAGAAPVRAAQDILHIFEIEPFLGIFRSPRAEMILWPQGKGIAGTFKKQGKTYPVNARLGDERLLGSYGDGTGKRAFTAAKEGEYLVIAEGSKKLRLPQKWGGDFAGTYRGSGVTIKLQRLSTSKYKGILKMGGKNWAISARRHQALLWGTYSGSGRSEPFRLFWNDGLKFLFLAGNFNEVLKRNIRAKTKFKNSLGMEFVYIPAGSFLMGAETSKQSIRNEESPLHRVTILRAFYMQTTEATQGQWRQVMGTTPWKGRKKVKPGCPNCPAVYVSFKDIKDFVRFLNQKTGGRKYRLPTEAEWEYAARAGGVEAYGFGDDPSGLDRFGWYSRQGDEKPGPWARAVGGKKPNRWGLYDMHGNVWEWVQDWFESYPGGQINDSGGPPSGVKKIIRGGCWLSGAKYCRSAVRGKLGPGSKGAHIGFRLVREQ